MLPEIQKSLGKEKDKPCAVSTARASPTRPYLTPRGSLYPPRIALQQTQELDEMHVYAPTALERQKDDHYVPGWFDKPI